MFCPNCAERQENEATRFCSKCGFPTEGVKKLLEAADGQIAFETELSPRQKGIRQGAKLILLSLLLFPAFVLLSAMFPPNDRLVESSPSSTPFEQIGLTILWTIFLAGAARIAYALIFEKRSAAFKKSSEETKQIKSDRGKNALPPSESVPVSDFGKWKTTDELFEPIFVKRKTSGELK